ncbi:hypothetical protein [Streptomyces sp. NBC_01216]|uniref:hypothetical protein n=1 Tax=unclassified Streptomyces TaxID=2593676 RepID=UPI002E14256E|nr:hypothetical protein OG393_23120 [Streptomyces sp. NBC_01216]
MPSNAAPLISPVIVYLFWPLCSGQDPLHLIAQGGGVRGAVLRHFVALGGPVGVDVHGDGESTVPGLHHGQVPGQALLDLQCSELL